MFLFLRFLTFISLILVLFWRVTSRYVDLPLMALIVAFGAFPIVYIFPRKVMNPLTKRFISGAPLYLSDLLLHWLPLFFVATNRFIDNSLNYEKIFVTISLFFVYVAVANPFVLYGLDADLSTSFLLLAIFLRYVMGFNHQTAK